MIRDYALPYGNRPLDARDCGKFDDVAQRGSYAAR